MSSMNENFRIDSYPERRKNEKKKFNVYPYLLVALKKLVEGLTAGAVKG